MTMGATGAGGGRWAEPAATVVALRPVATVGGVRGVVALRPVATAPVPGPEATGRM
ncbi:MAG: hypothetical protein ACRDZQ_12335 [Acidimicrobiales bacterium]